jgi:hypothetical protein
MLASDRRVRRGRVISYSFKTLGFAACMLAASAFLAEPALAKTAPQRGTPQPRTWYQSNGDVLDDCVERSFSISVGNPGYPNRLAIWPAPCRP